MPTIKKVTLKEIDTAPLFNNKLLSDVKVVVTDHTDVEATFHCHRFVLEAASPFFRDQKMNEGDECLLEYGDEYLPTFRFDEEARMYFTIAIEATIKWMYTAKCIYPKKEHWGGSGRFYFDVLMVSRIFQLKALQEEVMSKLQADMEDERKALEMYSDLLFYTGEYESEILDNYDIQEVFDDLRERLSVRHLPYLSVHEPDFISGYVAETKAGDADHFARALNILKQESRELSQAVDRALALAYTELRGKYEPKYTREQVLAAEERRHEPKGKKRRMALSDENDSAAEDRSRKPRKNQRKSAVSVKEDELD